MTTINIQRKNDESGTINPFRFRASYTYSDYSALPRTIEVQNIEKYSLYFYIDQAISDYGTGTLTIAVDADFVDGTSRNNVFTATRSTHGRTQGNYYLYNYMSNYDLDLLKSLTIKASGTAINDSWCNEIDIYGAPMTWVSE